MDSKRNMFTVFREWSFSAIKRSSAVQLCKTLEQVDWFLHETRIIKCSFLELMPDDMLRCVADLNRNRVFKFRNREAMPWLGKLSNALSDFAVSKEYTDSLVEFDITPISLRRRGDPTDVQHTALAEGNAAELKARVEERVGESSASIAEQPVVAPVQDTEEADILPEERPEEKAVRSILEKCVIKLNGATISKS